MDDAKKLHEYAQYLVRRQSKEIMDKATVNHEEMAERGLPPFARQTAEMKAETFKRDAEAWSWVEDLVRDAIVGRR